MLRSGLIGVIEEKDVDQAIARMAFRLQGCLRLGGRKPHWADKTPDYFTLFLELARLAPVSTQYIAMLRDPYDIPCSVNDRRWNLTPITEDVFEHTVV